MSNDANSVAIIGVGLHPFGRFDKTAMEMGAEAIHSALADAGIAWDGDADRCLAVDAAGQVIDGDQIMAILAVALKDRGELTDDTLVATVMSNLGLRRALSRHGITQHETPVGDRAVVAAMREHGFGLGGEQSGHVIFDGDGHHTGDGIYTALRLLSVPVIP